MNASRTAIRACIDRVMNAPDAKTAAQQERRLRERLGDTSVDRMTAAAARRIGAWLAGVAP